MYGETASVAYFLTAARSRLMGLARSTFYDEPSTSQSLSEARLVECIGEIAAEWPCYGYRGVTAELHAQGRRVNHKTVMRLMQENGLSVASEAVRRHDRQRS